MIWNFLVILALAFAVVGAAPPRGKPVVGEGVIRSEERVAIKSKVASPVRQVAVQEGRVVRQGELLMEMANEVERARAEAAKAEVARARAEAAEAEIALKIAARELERNLKVPDLLTEKELEVSRDAVRKAAAVLKTKLAELAKAEAFVQVAEADYDETLLRAPFDGVVSRVYARVGDTPKISDTVLLDVLSLDRLYVEVALPLPDLHRVQKGMVARLEVEGEHPSIKTSLKGKVSYVYPEIDSTTRMFRAKVEVPRNEFLVFPGMFVKVIIDPRR